MDDGKGDAEPGGGLMVTLPASIINRMVPEGAKVEGWILNHTALD